MTDASLLRRALHGPADPPLRSLPDRVVELLTALDCPPRPAAHLRAVHDVAHRLTEWAGLRRAAVALDRESVLFGAATHDIGKVLHPGELSGPGSAHEHAGRELLLGRGVEPGLARFAATHASWTAPGVVLEDLLVSLDDLLTRVGEDADRRLAFQASFPVRS